MNNRYYCLCRPCQPQLPGIYCPRHPTITSIKRRLTYISKRIISTLKKQKFYLGYLEHPSFIRKYNNTEVQHKVLEAKRATYQVLETLREEREFLRNQLAVTIKKGRL